MVNRFSRTELLLGADAMQRLSEARVIVFGVGGVGGYVVEALARSGVGNIDVVDNDVVSLTNINRQIIATTDTIGKYKTDIICDRVLAINPECKVKGYRTFYLPETENLFNLSDYDYVVDAIDTVAGKLAIITNAKKTGVPVISAMGAGNKTDPKMFEVADISETSVCPLARVMRAECRKRGIEGVKVVYSKQKPVRPVCAGEEKPVGSRRDTPGSLAYVPSVAGLILASEVVNDLIQSDTEAPSGEK